MKLIVYDNETLFVTEDGMFVKFVTKTRLENPTFNENSECIVFFCDVNLKYIVMTCFLLTLSVIHILSKLALNYVTLLAWVLIVWTWLMYAINTKPVLIFNKNKNKNIWRVYLYFWDNFCWLAPFVDKKKDQMSPFIRYFREKLHLINAK